MTIAKVINVGSEQLIALPTGFHINAEHVSISKNKNSFLIKAIPNTDNSTEVDISERQASFLAWRRAYEATIDDIYKQDFDNPWENLRSKNDGREFNWEN